VVEVGTDSSSVTKVYITAGTCLTTRRRAKNLQPADVVLSQNGRSRLPSLSTDRVSNRRSILTGSPDILFHGWRPDAQVDRQIERVLRGGRHRVPAGFEAKRKSGKCGESPSVDG
jgi:hypothetical protein